MNVTAQHLKPAIHNAMWPGLVGKGPDSEPPIDLETMLDLTVSAEVNGVKFDGVDLFASLPHIDIDSTRDDLAHRRGNHKAQSGCWFFGCAGVASNRRRLRHGLPRRTR